MEPIGLKVSKRGYIVLPARFRRQMNMKSGTNILLRGMKTRFFYSLWFLSPME